ADLTPRVKGGEYLDPGAAIDAIAAVANQGKK
ncbi:MAG: phosphoglyceromutase, partial [Actinobacteria bacterium]|nr:phosphoglyceromutase [Actinomycetota bacterium]